MRISEIKRIFLFCSIIIIFILGRFGQRYDWSYLHNHRAQTLNNQGRGQNICIQERRYSGERYS